MVNKVNSFFNLISNFQNTKKIFIGLVVVISLFSFFGNTHQAYASIYASFSDNVAAGPETSDLVTATADGSGSAYWGYWGIASGTVCDGTVSYPNAFGTGQGTTSATMSYTFTPSSTTQGKYLCIESTDGSIYKYTRAAYPFNWTTYTLTYVAGTGGTISGTTPQTVIYNTNGTPVTAVPNTGYNFSSWSPVNATATRQDNYVTASATYTANFTPYYTFGTSVVANGATGTGISCNSGTCASTYNSGTAITVGALFVSGYTVALSGTGSASACSGTSCSVTITSNTTVTATYTPNTFTFSNSVVANGATGTGIKCNGTTCASSYNGGTSIIVTTNAVAGYTVALSGTGSFASCSGTSCTYSISANSTVTATYTKINYILTISNPSVVTITGTNVANCTTSSCTPSVPYGTVVTLTAPARTGYTFAWSGTACSGATCSFTQSTTALNATLTYTPISYTLTFSKTGTGSASGSVTATCGGVSCVSGASVPYNQTVVITAPTASTGSTYTGISGACTSSTSTCTFSMPASTASISVNYTLNTYTVTGSAGAGGTISPSTRSVNYNTATTFTVTPNTGYSASASGCGGSLSGTTYTTGAITAACTVTASFSLIYYTYTFNSNGATVNASPTSVTQNYGTSITAPTSPTKTGYTFGGWSPTIPATMPVGGGTSTAVWNANSFTVTFDINGGSGGTMAPQSLVYNTPTALTSNAFTKTGYTFNGWATTPGGTVAYADGASYTIGAANVTLYAHWVDQTAPTTPGIPTASWVGGHYINTNVTFSTSGSTDSGSGIRGYRLCRSADNSSGCSTWTANGEHSGTSEVVSGTDLPSNGTYRYYYWYAYDNAGNQSSASTGEYIVMDTNGPSGAITFPANGASYYASSWGAIAGTASDPAGVNYTELLVCTSSSGSSYYWNGASWQAGCSFGSGIHKTGTSWTDASLGTSNLTFGYTYSLYTRAFDALGNITYITNPWTFTYNNTAPPMSTPATPGNGTSVNGNGSNVTFTTSTVTDADGQTVQYYFRVATGSDAETGVVCNSGWQTSTSYSCNPGPGTYYWHVYTYDGIAQTNPNYVWSFYNNYSPSGISVSPTSGNFKAGAQTFTSVYRDPNGATDINYVHLLINYGVDGNNTAFYGYYIRATDSCYLYGSDGNQIWNAVPYALPFVTLTSCSSSVSGTDLTVNWNLNFTNWTESNMNEYLYVVDNNSVAWGWGSSYGLINVDTTATYIFDSNGATVNASPTSVTQNYGTAIATPTPPTKIGYTFAGWSPAIPATMPVNGGTSVAQWTINSYTYTFAGNGATVDASPASVTQNYATAIATPTPPTKTGYTFIGWSPSIPATMPVGGGTSTAQWNTNSYTVTFDINGGTGGSTATQSFNYGVPAALNSNGFIRTNYSFANWNTAANGSGTTYADGASYTIGAANVTLYAQWNINTYTLTTIKAGGSVGSISSSTGGISGCTTSCNSTPINWNTVVTVTGAAASGYAVKFTGCTLSIGGGVGNSGGCAFSISAATTITVTYVAPPTVVTSTASSINMISAQDGGNITDLGYENNDERGIVYDTTSYVTNPGNVAPASTSYTKTPIKENGTFSSTGTFGFPMTGLIENTIYYVRAYAHNPTGGYAYGNEVPFTTSAFPTISQSAFRVFTNIDSPSVGSPLSSLNGVTSLNNANDPFRLRMLLHLDSSGSSLPQSAANFKLQYSLKSGTCDASFSGETYADITTETPIAFYNNFTPNQTNTMLSDPSDPTDGSTINLQTYVQSSIFTNSISAIPAGQDAEWDFGLYDKSSTGASYCIRTVRESGATLSSYPAIPEIVTAQHKNYGGAGSVSVTQCNDGIDNNSNGLIDTADPNCHLNGDINQSYLPFWDNESVAPINYTGGGQGGGGSIDTTGNGGTTSGGGSQGGGGGSLGFLFDKIYTIFKWMPFNINTNLLLGMASHIFS